MQPILHESTFYLRLHAQNDKVDNLFLALLASVLAVTLVHVSLKLGLSLLQVPKDFLPYDEDIRGIAARCHKVSQENIFYDPPTIMLVTIRYLNAVYHFVLGNKGAWSESSPVRADPAASLGESTRLALFLDLHRESSYPMGESVRK